MKLRRGYAIIEMILVMTSLVVIFGLCVGLIHALLSLDRAGRAHLAQGTTIHRLARQFREDARAASRSRPDGIADKASDRLELTRPDGRVVRYETHGRRLTRVEQEGEKTVRLEYYALPAHGSVTFRVRKEGSQSFAVLSFPRKALENGDELVFEALLGKDARLAIPREPSR